MKNRIGEKHITNEGYEIEIVEYSNVNNISIMFSQDKHIVRSKCYKDVKNGSIKNFLHKSVLGIGYFGYGEYNSKVHKKQYFTWRNMMTRCYDDKFHIKQPTYKNCRVIPEWHNFQNFAHWFDTNYQEGWQLDKDILVKNNKIYSPRNCCFIPTEINLLFTKNNSSRGKYPIGVHFNKFSGKFRVRMSGYCKLFDTPEEAFQAYKKEKELYVKKVADKWKDKLSYRIYQALVNYKVKITD